LSNDFCWTTGVVVGVSIGRVWLFIRGCCGNGGGASTISYRGLIGNGPTVRPNSVQSTDVHPRIELLRGDTTDRYRIASISQEQEYLWSARVSISTRVS
jgi:hypothetical protein